MKSHSYSIIAPLSKDIDSLFFGIREYAPEIMVLLADDSTKSFAGIARQSIEGLGVPVTVLHIPSCNGVREVSKVIYKIAAKYGRDNLIINSVSGNSLANSIILSAAFINGISAFTIRDGEIINLPVMKYPYYRFIGEKKLKILQLLNKEKCCNSLEELGKKIGMSLPLISYHINGNRVSKGLKALDLVDIDEKKGKVKVMLSRFGKQLIAPLE
ncbi:MAG: hypothetical protein KAS15_06580 [Nanoarchaeota archaeon]|nr:hypothetical protein [Nanoarchaeota archaeon]MCK5630123.1 hypothetical protein [Nanoarchaeota archaeon]